MDHSIKMPALQHRWRLIVDSHGIELNNNVYEIMRAVTKCDFNYKTKEITLYLIQDADGDLHSTVFDLCNKGNIPLRIDILSGKMGTDNDVEIIHSCEYTGSHVIDHHLGYDYAEKGVVQHTITIKFNNIILLIPEKA